MNTQGTSLTKRKDKRSKQGNDDNEETNGNGHNNETFGDGGMTMNLLVNNDVILHTGGVIKKCRHFGYIWSPKRTPE